MNTIFFIFIIAQNSLISITMVKKIFVLFFALTAILTGCQQGNPGTLDTPALNLLDKTPSSFTVSWAQVPGADNYVYTLNGGQESATDQTMVTFNDLETAIYTLKVKAVNATTESAWGELVITLTPSEEDGFNVAISVSNIEATSATVDFLPSNANTQYMGRVTTVGELAGLNISTDDEIIRFMLENPDQLDYVHTGAKTIELERLKANMEYIALAFEYKAADEVETLFKKTFTTKNETVEKVIEVSNVTPDYTGVAFDVVPSSNEEFWYYYPMEKVNYEEYGDQAMMRAYYGMQNLALNLGYTEGIGQYLNEVALQGAQSVEITDLKNNTEYVVMVFYVNPTNSDPTNVYDWNYTPVEFSTLAPSSDAPVVTIATPDVKADGTGTYTMKITVKVDASTTKVQYAAQAYEYVKNYYDQGWEAIKAFFFLKEINAEMLAQAKTSDGLTFVYEGVDAGDYVFLIEASNAQGVLTYEGVRIDTTYFQ